MTTMIPLSGVMLPSLNGVSGVYAILNQTCGKIYIGYTSDFVRRFRAHRGCLKRGNHPNAHLQRAFIKDGINPFLFCIVQVAPSPEDAQREEDRWLKLVGGTERCYNFNVSSMGRGCMSEHSKMKMVKSLKEWWTPDRRVAHGIRLTGRKQPRTAVDKTAAYHARSFSLTSPTGVLHEGKNLSEFARRNGLNPKVLNAMVNGSFGHYRGWRVTKK